VLKVVCQLVPQLDRIHLHRLLVGLIPFRHSQVAHELHHFSRCFRQPPPLARSVTHLIFAFVCAFCRPSSCVGVAAAQPVRPCSCMYSSSAIDFSMSPCAFHSLRPRDLLSVDESVAPTIFAKVFLNSCSPYSIVYISVAALYTFHGTIGIL
jgi:hypothetical protein